MNVRIRCQFLISLATMTIFGIGAVQAWSQPTATTTTLGINSGGNAVTTVSAGSLVTLTATVVGGTTPVTVGQVNFCDASAEYCTDIHVLGTAQLIQAGPSAGTAVFRFIPAIGGHSYKAVFAGTPGATTAYAASTSSTLTLTVTGNAPTTTVIAASGSAGNYSLTATVAGTNSTPLSGTVSFLDTTNANASLGMATLDAGSAGLSISTSNIPLTLSRYNPVSMATGDFNGDGILDLALAGQGDSTLGVLLGNGDGTFKVAPSPPTGFDTGVVVVGDFNGDGILDLAVFTECGSNPECTVMDLGAVTILLGNGDGTFTATTVSPATNTAPTLMVVGDFNGDGKADLAVANRNYMIPGGTNTTYSPTTILLGNGDGTFTTGASLAINNDISSMVVGDFNGDGNPDLAVTTGVFTGDPLALTVFLGNGDGFFTAVPSMTLNNHITSMVVGDYNGDGNLDLILASQTAPLTLLLGNGNGTFTAAESPTAPGPVLSIAVGDFNGDGIADLGIFYQVGDCTVAGDGGVAALLGNGDGAFTQATSALNVECGFTNVVGDFNGGGIADLADAGLVLSGPSNLSVVIPQLTATTTATGISPLGTGTHQVEASYSGNTIYGPSISATTPLQAQQGKPTVTVTLSSSSITTMQPVTVVVNVSGGSGNPTPTGSVTLTSGTYTSAATTLSSGGASITVPAGSLPAGSDTLTASYSGDTNYTAATGTASVTVTNPTFAITGTAVSVSPGATTGNTSTITLTPGGGFTGSVALTAALTSSPAGAQNPPTLSFGSTSPINITGANAGTATLSVTTTAATNSALAYPALGGVYLYSACCTTLGCVLFLGIPARRLRTQKRLGMLFLIAILSSGILACGGGNGGTGGSGNPGTTAGTYTVTVTGTSGTTTAVCTVTLTVQ